MGQQLAEAPRFGSPWGRIQDRRKIAEGIWVVSTASHGGVWVAPELREKIPADLPNWLNDREWWEEDSDAKRVLDVLLHDPEVAAGRRAARALEPCHACGGDGWGDGHDTGDGNTTCRYCNGTGKGN